MGLSKLAHYSIRTDDLNASEHFYVEILGLRPGFRPPFAFPGRWLYLGEDEKEFGVVHLVGIDRSDPEALTAYLGDKGEVSTAGSGAVDHMAFRAEDWSALRQRCDGAGLQYTTRVIPSLGLLQVFLDDPSGVTVELNFSSAEAKESSN